MREIKAIIRRDRLSGVVHALHEINGMPGMTVSVVHGYGRADSEHPGRTEPIVETQLAKLETVVPLGLVDLVVATIRSAAHTGRPGDGKIFVIPVEAVKRIGTLDHSDPTS